jgi:O-antigen/teichoic acid export membrane protein
MRRQFSASVAWGSASAALALVAGIVTTPIYLRAFGAEGLGVIGFIAALQAIIVAMDAGVAVSATRAIAQAQGDDSRAGVTRLMRSLEALTWIAAAVVGAMIVVVAPAIAGRWLNVASSPASHVGQALMVAAPAIALRWPIALLQAVLAGNGQLVDSSRASIGATLLAAGGGIAIVMLLTPDLRALFAWQALVAAMQSLWLVRLARRGLPGLQQAQRATLVDFLRASSLTGWLGVVGLLVSQADKIVLTRVLPVGAFGYYTIGTLFAGGIYAIVAPVYNAALPRFCLLAGSSSPDALRSLYRDLTFALSVAIFPVASSVAFFSGELVFAWTRDAAAAQASAPLVALLTVAAAVHGVMFMPYALTLAKEQTRLALHIALATLIVCVPLMAVAGINWGAPGAAAAWLLIQLAYLLGGSWLTHRLIMRDVAWKWLLLDVGAPAALSFFVGWSVDAMCRAHDVSDTGRAIAALFLVPACWASFAFCVPRIRRAARMFVASRSRLEPHAETPA